MIDKGSGYTQREEELIGACLKIAVEVYETEMDDLEHYLNPSNVKIITEVIDDMKAFRARRGEG